MADGESAFGLFEVHRGSRMDSLGWKTGIRQLCRQRHREASRVSGADQFFGVGAGSVLHPRLERVGAVKGTRTQLHVTLAFAKSSLPFCFGIAHWHRVISSG